MSWIMTIAVGAAIGYFAYQIILNNKNGEATGRLHKSTIVVEIDAMISVFLFCFVF